MHRNKLIACFFYLPFILLPGCVGDDPPVVESRPPKSSAKGNETKKSAPEPTNTVTTPPAPPAETQSPTAEAKSPTAEAKSSTAEAKSPTAEAKSPTAEAKSPTAESKSPAENPPAPSEPTRNAQAAAPEKKVENRDIPGENKSRTPDLRVDGIHDPGNPALTTMQNPSQSLSALPLGKWGEIDWMQALRQKAIRPRAAIASEGKMELLDLDIIMTNTKSMPHVRFPHDSHTQWLACTNCHPAIFAMKKGETPITMDGILKGQFCGSCHGKVAFSSYICQRCHSIVHEGSPNKWW